MGFGSFISSGLRDISSGLHDVKNFFDPDTSVPPGTDPAAIYGWFHNGPGTASYSSAATALHPAVQSMQGYTKYLSQAQQALSAGWTGSAADAAQQSFTPLNQSAQQVSTHASDLNTHLNAQVTQFNDTKSKVVNVPTTPPSGPGLGDYISMVNPVTMPAGAVGITSADMSVSDYQNNAHGNQQAYSGYQGPTKSQAAALPQGGNTTAPPPPPNQPVTAPPSGNPVHLSGGVPSAHGTYGSSQGSQYSGSYQGSNGMNTNPGANPNMPSLGSNNPTNLGSGTTSAQGYTPPNVSNPPGTNPYGGGSGGYSPGGGGFGGVGGAGGGSSAAGGFAGGFGAGGLGSGGGYGGSGGYGSSSGAGGRSGAGGMGAEEEEAGGFGSAAAGAKGSTGATGMGGAGRGGKGQGDTEHKTASYLQENDPNAIFGTDEKTVPPVIGG
ncbi:MAG TPA: WXG100 family type VII secretion target [Pseudonocardiaceae bacterium]|jgi:uncharacterized protein YukE|nr:WXG100 family type VII secretion target [Pseudonocardiaceae bacterium]